MCGVYLPVQKSCCLTAWLLKKLWINFVKFWDGLPLRQEQLDLGDYLDADSDSRIFLRLFIIRETTSSVPGGREALADQAPHGERGALWGSAAEPQRGPRADEPLVRESEGEAPEAECFFAFAQPEESANLALIKCFLINTKISFDVWLCSRPPCISQYPELSKDSIRSSWKSDTNIGGGGVAFSRSKPPLSSS